MYHFENAFQVGAWPNSNKDRYACPDNTDGGDPSNYFILDLGSATCVVSKIVVINQAFPDYYLVSSYAVDVSDDPNTFPNMVSGTFPIVSDTVQQEVAIGKTGRYLRFNMVTAGTIFQDGYTCGLQYFGVVGSSC